MKLENIFVYGTLMNEDKLKKLCGEHIEILGINPAMVQGKLVKGDKFPILLHNGVGMAQRAPYVVYGALISCKINEQGLARLDAYEGCSKSRTGYNLSSDLYHRDRIDVRRIFFDNIKDFVAMKIRVEDEKDSVQAWTYIGNYNHPYVKRKCKVWHSRAGVVWNTFFMQFDK